MCSTVLKLQPSQNEEKNKHSLAPYLKTHLAIDSYFKTSTTPKVNG